MTISISISISIFFKSVNISTIDIQYRYIEQGYVVSIVIGSGSVGGSKWTVDRSDMILIITYRAEGEERFFDIGYGRVDGTQVRFNTFIGRTSPGQRRQPSFILILCFHQKIIGSNFHVLHRPNDFWQPGISAAAKSESGISEMRKIL